MLHRWSPPENVGEVWTFLGFTTYYRCFIDGYSKIAVPLTRMLYKNAQYMWNEEEQTAFEKL